MQKNFGPTSVSRIARWNQKFLLAFLYAESTISWVCVVWHCCVNHLLFTRSLATRHESTW